MTLKIAPLVLAGVLVATGVLAQSEDANPPGSATQVPRDTSPAVENPWPRRPVCASLFLKSDWQLTRKQRACDWIQNRMFSNGSLFGAFGSATVSKIRNAEAEQGDRFAVRFGRRFAQSAFKSTGAYVGTVIAREDPRLVPPYLQMTSQPRPTGFWRRKRHALANNLMSYACV